MAEQRAGGIAGDPSTTPQAAAEGGGVVTIRPAVARDVERRREDAAAQARMRAAAAAAENEVSTPRGPDGLRRHTGATFAADRPGRGGLQALGEHVAAEGEGNRNNLAYWASMRAVEEDYATADIVDVLGRAARQAGLERTEAIRTIRSGIGRAERQGKRGRLAQRRAEPDLEAQFEAWEAAGGAAEDEAWAAGDDEEEVTTGEVGLLDFLNEKLSPPSWLVDELVPVGPSVGLLVGQFKAGKSLAGLQLCVVVAVGKHDFLGRDVGDGGGPAVFVEYEGSKARLQERVRLMVMKFGALEPPAPLSVIHRPKFKIDTDEGEAWLRRVCTGKVLCIIGPVSKAASLKHEVDAAEWQELAERVERIADATGCTIVLVHHTRKPSQEFGPPKKVDDYFNSARGSNAYMGAVDFGLGVQRPPEEAEGVFYFLERDGESGRLHYAFDVPSLCIWPDDRPIARETRQARVDVLYAFIEANPGCTRKAMAAHMGVSPDTLKGYLDQFGERIAEEGEGSMTRTYRVSD